MLIKFNSLTFSRSTVKNLIESFFSQTIIWPLATRDKVDIDSLYHTVSLSSHDKGKHRFIRHAPVNHHRSKYLGKYINTISLRATHLSQDTQSSRRNQNGRVRESLKPYELLFSPFLHYINSAWECLWWNQSQQAIYVSRTWLKSKHAAVGRHHVSGVNWLDKTSIEASSTVKKIAKELRK